MIFFDNEKWIFLKFNIQIKSSNIKDYIIKHVIVQSAGAVENTHCISAEG